MLTIYLSGPKAAESQARTALGSRGFKVLDTVRDHGLPPFATEGEATSEPQSFIQCEGDDINAANDAVSPLGWRLRMHHNPPQVLPPDPDQETAATLAEMRRELDELKAKAA